jgi:hypothetical protein
MRLGQWKRTGEPVIVDTDGWLEDAGHRCWSCYFGKVTFPSYVVTDVPAEPNLFA